MPGRKPRQKSPPPRLKGQQCECAACGKVFNSSYAFDKHRYGPYSGRSCLTEREMLTAGMEFGRRGWVSERRPTL